MSLPMNRDYHRTPNNYVSISTRKSSMIGLDNTSRAKRSASASRLIDAQRAVNRNFKILALANIADAVEAQQLDRMFDGFALRIEHARFESDVNFSFHWFSISSEFRV